MITKELLAYIQKQVAKGVSVSVIAQKLEDNGWKREDIEQGFFSLSVFLPKDAFEKKETFEEKKIEKKIQQDSIGLEKEMASEEVEQEDPQKKQIGVTVNKYSPPVQESQIKEKQSEVTESAAEESVEEVVIYEEESHSKFPYLFVIVLFLLGALAWGYYTFFMQTSKTVISVSDVVGKTAQISSVSYENTYAVGNTTQFIVKGKYNHKDTPVRNIHIILESYENTPYKLEVMQNNSTLFVRFIELADILKEEGLVEGQWFAVNKNSVQSLIELSSSLSSAVSHIESIVSRSEQGLPSFFLLDENNTTVASVEENDENTTFVFSGGNTAKGFDNGSVKGTLAFKSENLYVQNINISHSNMEENILFNYEFIENKFPSEESIKTFQEIKTIISNRKKNTLIKAEMRTAQNVLQKNINPNVDLCMMPEVDSLKVSLAQLTDIQSKSAFEGTPVFFVCKSSAQDFIIMSSLLGSNTLFCVDSKSENTLSQPSMTLSCS